MDFNRKFEWLLGVFVVIMTGIISIGYSYAEPGKGEKKITVVVDAGHGGYDPGKVGINDALEKDINLLIAGYLKEYLEDEGYNVIMTRTSDDDLQSEDTLYKKVEDLKKRCDLIEEEKADYAISIHQNSYTDANISGAQVFYYSGSMEGEQMARVIQKSLIDNLDKENRRQAKESDSYYMLKNSACPTVIVECGFLSNRTEADKLCTEEYQRKVAEAICKGFSEFCKGVNK